MIILIPDYFIVLLDQKIKNLFADTLVPFYGMKTDKDNTIIKIYQDRRYMNQG